MSYNIENIQKVKELLATRRANAVSTSMQRKAEMAARLPGFRELDDALAKTGERIMEAAFSHTLDENKLAAIRADNERLREKRGALLMRCGFPSDYTDIHYTCEACSDTGYQGIDMCNCMRKELIKAGIESAGLSTLIRTQTFETFRLEYYTDKDRALMEQNVRQLWQFATNFSEGDPTSWLFFGATGLGKTHLSTAVAGVIISRGFDVIYDSVQELLAVYEEARFGHGEGVQHQKGRTVSALMECDLLVMDDLGAELTNQFTVSSLYNMINTRINKGKSTIINTNLDHSEIRTRYTDRIASRLFGEYKPLLFRGVDIRSQKLKTTHLQ